MKRRHTSLWAVLAGATLRRRSSPWPVRSACRRCRCRRTIRRHPRRSRSGSKLFHDKRFSSTGEVSCATCHDATKAFTDSPLKTSEGINKLTGTRNAPTVVNAAYIKTPVLGRPLGRPRGPGAAPVREPGRDGAEEPRADPEDRPQRPGLRPAFKTCSAIERRRDHDEGGQAGDRGLRAHDRRRRLAVRPLVLRRREDGDERIREPRLRRVPRQGTLRLLPRDRAGPGAVHRQPLPQHRRRHQPHPGRRAADRAEVPRGEGQGHGRGQGRADRPGASELGRFAVTDGLDELGSFKTPTLRNIAVTAPYMHDGSLQTLRDVVVHYNNGGVTKKGDPVNDFLSGGIRPLNLTDEQITDLVAFMEALTSPQHAKPATRPALAGGAQP